MQKKNSSLVVKDNALINASYNLDLVEQRLILLAIVEAREKGQSINTNDTLTVHAESYVTQFGVHRNTAYQALKDACENLFERRFSYERLTSKGNREYVKSRWVQEISYVENEALVRIKFSSAVAPLILNLERQFTSYELEQVSDLRSAYAIRLYELLIAWKSVSRTPVFELDEFRARLGVDRSEYKQMNNFKNRVLDVAVVQINKHTDITARYEQHKTGRKITGFSFSYKKDAKAASKSCSQASELLEQKTLTAKQLGYYAKLLAESHWATQAKVLQGVNTKDVVTTLMEHLKRPEFFDKHKKLIEKLIKG